MEADVVFFEDEGAGTAGTVFSEISLADVWAVSMSESPLSVVSCSIAVVTPLPLSMLTPLAGLAGCSSDVVLQLPIGAAAEVSDGLAAPPGNSRSMSARPNWQPGGRVSSLQRASSTVLSHTKLVYSLAKDPNT